MTALAGRLGQAGAARGAAEIQDFLLLMAINRMVPVIRMQGDLENLHPAQVYRDCLAIAGELATFMAPKSTRRRSRPIATTT
jgi:type VI secretion system protein ImpJ